jgi:hypothetical protein
MRPTYIFGSMTNKELKFMHVEELSSAYDQQMFFKQLIKPSSGQLIEEQNVIEAYLYIH